MFHPEQPLRFVMFPKCTDSDETSFLHSLSLYIVVSFQISSFYSGLEDGINLNYCFIIPHGMDSSGKETPSGSIINFNFTLHCNIIVNPCDTACMTKCSR
jgi:hypothetical protein